MRNKHSFFLGSLYLLVWTAWGTAPEAPASAFTVHKIFGSNMVLQSDRPIKISGNAAPGEIIRVSLGSHCADGVAGKDGEWCGTAGDEGRNAAVYCHRFRRGQTIGGRI